MNTQLYIQKLKNAIAQQVIINGYDAKLLIDGLIHDDGVSVPRDWRWCVYDPITGIVNKYGTLFKAREGALRNLVNATRSRGVVTNVTIDSTAFQGWRGVRTKNQSVETWFAGALAGVKEVLIASQLTWPIIVDQHIRRVGVAWETTYGNSTHRWSSLVSARRWVSDQMGYTAPNGVKLDLTLPFSSGAVSASPVAQTPTQAIPPAPKPATKSPKPATKSAPPAVPVVQVAPPTAPTPIETEQYPYVVMVNGVAVGCKTAKDVIALTSSK